eukprot:1017008-Rhodomonas_salina.2
MPRTGRRCMCSVSVCAVERAAGGAKGSRWRARPLKERQLVAHMLVEPLSRGLICTHLASTLVQCRRRLYTACGMRALGKHEVDGVRPRSQCERGMEQSTVPAQAMLAGSHRVARARSAVS